jgi:hypothetical protein
VDRRKLQRNDRLEFGARDFAYLIFHPLHTTSNTAREFLSQISGIQIAPEASDLEKLAIAKTARSQPLTTTSQPTIRTRTLGPPTMSSPSEDRRTESVPSPPITKAEGRMEQPAATSAKRVGVKRTTWLKRLHGLINRQDSSGMPTATIDPVHFSVTSHSVVLPGTTFVINVWAHLEEQRKEVVLRAQEAADGIGLREWHAEQSF